MNNYAPIPKNDRLHHAPLRTITELAEELGLTRQVLSGGDVQKSL